MGPLAPGASLTLTEPGAVLPPPPVIVADGGGGGGGGGDSAGGSAGGSGGTVASPPPGTPSTPAPNHTPAFVSSAKVAATAGKKFSFTVTTSGYPFPKLTHSALPSGLHWTDEAGGKARIWGVPAAAAAGTAQVKLTASNAVGSSKQVLSISVESPPALGPWLLPAATAGRHYSFSAPALGFPTPVITESGLPAGLGLSLKGTGKATLSGVPAKGSGGLHHVKVTASNVLGRTSATYTITVGEAPAITSKSKLRIAAGRNFSFTLNASGYPHANFAHTTLPAGLKWVNQASKSSNMPGISGKFTTKQLGVHHITITAENSFGTTRQVLTIEVT